MTDPDKEFVYQLTDWQGRLLGYLATLLGDLNDARDVLQETNLVLWRKMDEFVTIQDFGSWARKCAYFQALAFLRDRKRDRHIFDDELLSLFAADADAPAPDEEEQGLALRECLAKLPEQLRNVIRLRYSEGMPVRQLASDFGQKESSMKMGLMRIRETLRVCIESKLRETAP